MRTGNNGHIAICWTQTELDGLQAASIDDLEVGVTWSWHGAKNSRMVANRSEISGGGSYVLQCGAGFAAQVQSRIELSNGAQRFVADVVKSDKDGFLGLVFQGGFPARDLEFWVDSIVECVAPAEIAPAADNVVAFPAFVSIDPSIPGQVAIVAAE